MYCIEIYTKATELYIHNKEQFECLLNWNTEDFMV